MNVNLNYMGHSGIQGDQRPMISKGMKKVLANYTFNNNGLLSHEAIKILDEGTLTSLSKVFKGPVIDLDAEIFHGVFAKDVLECAVTGKLN